MHASKREYLVFWNIFHGTICSPFNPTTLAHALTCCQSDYSCLKCLIVALAILSSTVDYSMLEYSASERCASMMLHSFSILLGQVSCMIRSSYRRLMVPVSEKISVRTRPMSEKLCKSLLKLSEVWVCPKIVRTLTTGDTYY